MDVAVCHDFAAIVPSSWDLGSKEIRLSGRICTFDKFQLILLWNLQIHTHTHTHTHTQEADIRHVAYDIGSTLVKLWTNWAVIFNNVPRTSYYPLRLWRVFRTGPYLVGIKKIESFTSICFHDQKVIIAVLFLPLSVRHEVKELSELMLLCLLLLLPNFSDILIFWKTFKVILCRDIGSWSSFGQYIKPMTCQLEAEWDMPTIYRLTLQLTNICIIWQCKDNWIWWPINMFICIYEKL